MLNIPPLLLVTALALQISALPTEINDSGSMEINTRAAAPPVETIKVFWESPELSRMKPKRGVEVRQNTVSPDRRTILQKFKDLLRNTAIREPQPYVDVDRQVFKPNGQNCMKEVHACGEARLFRRKLLARLDGLTVHNSPFLESSIRNPGKNSPLPLSISKSNATLTRVTTGWSLDANLVVKAGEFSLNVVGKYSNTKEKSNTFTTSFASTLQCPPRHECRFETWTFFAKVQGGCRSEQWIQCFEHRRDGLVGDNMCRENSRWSRINEGFSPYEPAGTCKHLFDIQARTCKLPIEKCEVEFPLKSEDGTPLRQIVGIEVPLPADEL
ncbi:hypothetical protein LOZ53_005501 [Ophidiomyces ophidiicola]|uniref:Uncharacterized protein n=1 Tax=Ophidiomyces ophidiicola TaxID=1387563 RepID=A0ACB8V2W4_9EURO|nr:hypothetical protein LOZ62_000714 [Ophidiomyces ophidiicola]KAI1973419.1 hypothetical protein LOZ56_001857 [Ophidiomyces ophidiicola]KAI1982517.1 hypothetical protein LOZ55_000299 [Ophidiomyces ophidiicola]KAI1984295.1 hypothetical protein LOZ53_005501 [Ophidiomyces ophidiicola]KAI1987451.1 hypothetical protein LOZ54_003584 [Ophidiomyces ophidiicola]